MKKLLSVILIISILFTSVNVMANDTNTGEQIIYLDGIEYNVSLSEDNMLYDIRIGGSSDNATVKFYSNGAADITLENDNEISNYSLDIREFHSEEIDLDIYKSDYVVDFNDELNINSNYNKGESTLSNSDYNSSRVFQYKEKNFKSDDYIETINDISEFALESYEGQAVIPIIQAIVWSILKAMEVIIMIAAIIIIGKITYDEVTKVLVEIKADTKKRNTIYPAILRNNAVYINYPTPFPNAQVAGAAIASGGSTYSWSQTMALGAVQASGFGVSAVDIDSDMDEGGIYYEHYHTVPKNGAHSWFGKPYTK